MKWMAPEALFDRVYTHQSDVSVPEPLGAEGAVGAGTRQCHGVMHVWEGPYE